MVGAEDDCTAAPALLEDECNPSAAAFIDQLCFDDIGLIPAISQDWLDGAVLMMAWMNRTALEQTLKSGQVHYWSRSRQELWHECTSGHTQILKGIRYDCDADVLLLNRTNRFGQLSYRSPKLFLRRGKPAFAGRLTYSPPMDACSELFG